MAAIYDHGASHTDPNKPMPQSEFEEYFAELTGKLEALEGVLGMSDFTKHFEDLKLQIKVLYEAMRERNFFLTTVL